MNTTKKVEPGAVVMLKSGGPKMTVAHQYSMTTSRKDWVCNWFDDSLNLGSGIFVEESLLVLDQ